MTIINFENKTLYSTVQCAHRATAVDVSPGQCAGLPAFLPCSASRTSIVFFLTCSFCGELETKEFVSNLPPSTFPSTHRLSISFLFLSHSLHLALFMSFLPSILYSSRTRPVVVDNYFSNSYRHQLARLSETSYDSKLLAKSNL